MNKPEKTTSSTQRPTSQEKPEPTILWLDDEEFVLATAARLLRGTQFQLFTTTDPDKAFQWIKEHPTAVIISDQRMPKITGIEFLKRTLAISPYSSRLLVSGFLDASVLQDAVNIARIHRLVSKPWNEKMLLEDLQEAYSEYKVRLQQTELMLSIREQNQRLEEWTVGLENVVAERTRSQEQAKNEVAEKQKRILKLNRLVKDLSEASDLEEIFSLLRSEIKNFAEVRGPILGIPNVNGETDFYHYTSGGLAKKITNTQFLSNKRIRIHELEDQVLLANLFGRPFIKVIAVPLLRRQSGEEQSPVLFLEHSLKDELVNPFLENIAERMQAFSIALDRVLLREQLESVAKRWSKTFDQIEEPIAIIDLDYRVLRGNAPFEKNLNENFCYARIAKKEQPCDGCPQPQSLVDCKPHSALIQLDQRLYDMTAYPIKMKGTEAVTHTVNYYHDVTEERKLYGRMIQTEKIAALGLLAGNVAHELNNPLTGIRSLAQILKGEVPVGQLRSDMEEVEKAAERSQKIIQDLLDFTKVEKQEHLELISLNDVINKTLPLLKTVIREHSTHLYLSEIDLRVKAQLNLLQQVVFNIVNNACQAMETAGQLTITTEKNGSMAQISIHDTGPGIPEAVMAHLFESFFTTKKEGTGTGLGLSISKSIVESFQGQIKVESKLGEGTTFYIQLPLQEVHS